MNSKDFADLPHHEITPQKLKDYRELCKTLGIPREESEAFIRHLRSFNEAKANGRKGGNARKKSMSAKQRKESASKAAKARWAKKTKTRGDEMDIEQAKNAFVAALSGGLSGPPDFQPVFPSEDVLDVLAAVHEPIGEGALELLREEIIDKWFTDNNPELLFERPTWAQAVLLIQEWLRREKTGEWDPKKN